MAFTLPNNGEVFIEQIIDRCKNLISSGIWNGLSQTRLDIWMKNFATPTERYFGACVLDCLIFRSEKQTVSLMEHLFQRTLPDLLRHHAPAGGPDLSWYDLLRKPSYESRPQICLVPVLKKEDPPTKSGPALARLYRRHLLLNEEWMIWPWQIEDAKKVGISQFLFIDDFLGTGDQFCEFAQQFGLADSLRGFYAVYAPLVAHKDGISTVQKFFPDLHITAVEVIDNRYSLFGQDSPWFDDGVNTPSLAREFYDDLAVRIHLPISPDALRGYGKLSLAYAFSHATPDNCLPIIWSEGYSWKPLLER